MTPTQAEVIKIIAKQLALNPEDIDRQTLLREELSLGPIELNDLLTELSNEFSISFDPQEVEHLNKVEDLISLVEDNLLD